MTTGLISGIFDGDLGGLHEARERCDRLIVAVRSDRGCRAHHSQRARVAALRESGLVDEVFVYTTEQQLRFEVMRLQPDAVFSAI